MRQLFEYRFRRTTLWLGLFLSVLAGVGLARLGWRLSGWWCVLALAFLVLSARRQQLVALICIVIFGLTTILWHKTKPIKPDIITGLIGFVLCQSMVVRPKITMQINATNCCLRADKTKNASASTHHQPLSRQPSRAKPTPAKTLKNSPNHNVVRRNLYSNSCRIAAVY